MTTPSRMPLAALASAITIFVWGAVSHMVLFKGAGYSRLPNDERVIAALRDAIPEDGLYFFPSPDFDGRATPKEASAWEARFRTGPTGMIVYHPKGDAPVSPRKLLVQFGADLLAASIAAYVASLLATRRQRVLAVTLFGAFAPLSVGIVFWNWYGFPTKFYLAQIADMVLGWLLAGVVIARVLPERQT